MFIFELFLLVAAIANVVHSLVDTRKLLVEGEATGEESTVETEEVAFVLRDVLIGEIAMEAMEASIFMVCDLSSFKLRLIMKMNLYFFETAKTKAEIEFDGCEKINRFL